MLIELIQPKLAVGWRFERLAKVIQSILLVAVDEMRHSPKEEKAIIISDFLEVAKILSHDGETGFLNSVLDKVSLE